MEIEAKFSVPDEQTFRRLLEVTSLAGFNLGEAAVAKLHDRYLDTADRAIRAGGYACRLRRKGDCYVATLKGLGGAVGAIHRRVEYEVELAEPLPPQDWPPCAARDLALHLCGNEPLIPLFDIEQARHSQPLCDKDRVVAEFSLDRVGVARGDVVASTYLELEVELSADGSEEDLKRLTDDLQEGWGLRPVSQSKYERALALFDVGMAYSRRAEEGAERHLAPKERSIVERLTQEREVIARRARLLLAWDDGLSRAEMVERSRLSPRRVRHWLSVFPQQRLGIFPERVLRTMTAAVAPPPPVAETPAALTEEAPIEQPPPAAAEKIAVEESRPAGGRVLLVEKVPAPSTPVTLLQKPGIEPDDPMSEAGRKILRFHYQRMLYHEPSTRQGEDIEALHDMRVATRRMRAAFRVFGDYFDPKVMSSCTKGLRQTGRALGAVRDLDVFREKIQAYLQTLPESQEGSLDELLGVLQDRREAARQQMIAYLNGKRYSRFVERFAEFVETEGMGGLPVAPNGDKFRPYRLRHVVPMAVYERLATVRAYDEWLNIPDPPLARLHALRIACKRLRYTLEFFVEVLGPDTRVLIKKIVAMQDHLGNLQDAVVASGILRDFLVWGTWGHEAADKRSLDLAALVVAPGVAAYLAAKQSELQHLLDTFPQAWKRLKGAKFSRMVAEAVSVL